MHWSRQVIALKAQSRTLQIFDLEKKQKLKSTTMNEDVSYWKWISETTLGMVTETSVYHWDVFDQSQVAPAKIFDRNTNLQVSWRALLIPTYPDCFSYLLSFVLSCSCPRCGIYSSPR